jgi:hypothetical protein
MYKTFSMIYLVQIGNYCHLNFISKFCTVTMLCFWTIGFYTFQGFQGYKVCKFWPYRTISMKFTSFSIYEFVSNLFELWKGHVALSHLRVPFRVDLKRDPLDLMEFGPPRSGHTGLLSYLIWAVDFESNGEQRWGEDHHRQLGFWHVASEVRHWNGRRRHCRCSRMRWRGRWGASGSGEADGVLFVLDCVLDRRQGVAGVAAAAVWLRLSMRCLITSR